MYVTLTSFVNTTNLLRTTLIGVWVTIWTTYGVALYCGTVEPPPSWPMISDTWAPPPGSYISRLFMPPLITAWALFCWCVSDWLDIFCERCDRLQNKTMRYTIQVGYVGFLGCIAINEDEINALHTIGALMFFVSQGIYCTHVTLRLRKYPEAASGEISIHIKEALVTMYWVVLVTFVFCFRVDSSRTSIAILEWLAVLIVSLYHLSLHWDIRDTMVAGVGNRNHFIAL